MLTAAKSYARFIKMSVIKNMKAAIEYRKSFIIQTVFMFINNFFFLIFWGIVFDVSGENINGITMNDILYLWSLPTLAYGIAFFFFGGTQKLGDYIVNGGIDILLLQPKNVIINALLSSSDFSAFGDILYGLLIGLFAVQFDLLKFLLLIILACIAALFFICTNIILRVISVWVGDTTNIEHIYTYTLLLTFSTYPENIFAGIIKFLMYTVIPAGYIAFMPIKIVSVYDFSLLLILIPIAITYILLTSLICQKALKKYESTNNVLLRD